MRALVPALLLLILPRTADASWSAEEVYAPPIVSKQVDLRLDSAQRPHLAFGEDALDYGVWNGASWDIEQVSGPGCILERELTLDATGSPVLCFLELATQDSADLKVARRSGGVWTIDLVASDATRYGECAIALTPGGATLVAYTAYNPVAQLGELRLATGGGSGWTLETIDASDTHVAMDLDAAGEPCIAYSSATGVHYARRIAGSFSIDTITSAPNLVAGLSVAHDAADLAAIGLLRWNVGTALELARPAGSGWSIERIDSENAGESVAWVKLAFAGTRPILAYGYQRPQGPKVAIWSGSAWSLELIEATGNPRANPVALALDPAGDPQVAYAWNGLKLARRGALGWMREDVVGCCAPAVDATLAFDTADRPAVAYTAATNLYLARHDGVAWTSERVDDAYWPGDPAPVAFAPDGNPAIAYLGPGEELRLTRWDGLAWRSETLDARVHGPALVFDPAGQPTLAYGRFGGASGYELVLARWNGSSWERTTIDQSGAFLTPVALAFEPSGSPALAYVDRGPGLGVVKFARWDGASWQLTPVTPAGTIPRLAVSLVFDGAGQPLVGYAVDSPGLEVASWNGSSFDIELAVAGGELGSLALDAAGRPSFAYLDSGCVLRFARREGSGWVTEPIDETPVNSCGSAVPALAFDRSGRPAAAYLLDSCPYDLRVARPSVGDLLHRGRVDSLGPGWRSAALPLEASNDDESAPFPLVTSRPGGTADLAPPAAPLVLYRLLGPAGEPRGDLLRLAKVGTGTRIVY